MLPLKTKSARLNLINEIVKTLEFLDYLKYEALIPVQNIIEREESKKARLVKQLERLEA